MNVQQLVIVGVAEQYFKGASMSNRKLKLGILLDSWSIPAWAYDAIRKIAQGNAAEFVLIVVSEDAEKTKFHWKTLLYSIFDRVDRKLFTRRPDPFAAKNAAEILDGVPVLGISPIGGKNILSESDIEIIRGYQLDIVLRFGCEQLELENSKIARCGTWFHFHGDDRIEKNGPAGFWETVDHWPETASSVIAAGGMFPRGRVLFRSHFVTYPFSPARHRSYYFWAATPFLSRQVNLLHELGEEKFFRETEKFNTVALHIEKVKAPSNLQTLTAAAKLTSRLIQEFARRVFYPDQWFLLFSLKNESSPNFGQFAKLIPPKGKFWADPHALRVGENYFIFIEEFSAAKNKGHISVIEMDARGNCRPPVTILEKPYHLSYPFVFEWDGRFYMIPESGNNRTIDLYECVEFPCRWNFKQSLMENVFAVDTTLVRHADKWWMFTALAEVEAAAPNVELFLFYTDDLLGRWTPHPRNPVISDVKRARPAGSFFLRDGKLIRPSQDCSHDYGYRMDLNEVEVLSETEYREKSVMSIRPDWDPRLLGTHTYASCRDLTVIDALKRTLNTG